MAKRTSKTIKPSTKPSSSYIEKLETGVQTNQSKVSMVLGALIILVIGILIFNYFNKNNSNLGPAQQAENQDQNVSPDKLPGKYTTKEGDTLFTIAEKYYQDGYKYTEIVKANNLTDENTIEVGQVLEIPKIETAQAQAKSDLAQASIEPSTPTASPEKQVVGEEKAQGEGTGGGDTTIWGQKIEGNTYTVAEGDWLSTIAGRAYGDILAFERIAKANNIENPDLITPGTVLTIPR